MKRNRFFLIFTLALCLLLPAGNADAENLLDLSCGQHVELKYQCMLPDGGLILTGSRDAFEAGKSSDSYVLCLNPDRTIRWEYTDMDKNGYATAEEATVLSDGTVAVIVWDYPRKIAVKFFTPENGKQARKKLDMTKKCGKTGQLYDLAPSFVMMTDWTNGPDSDDFDYVTILYDLNGKEITRFNGLVMSGGYGFAIKGTDELVSFGNDTVYNSHAKIMKMDGTDGRIIWETVLDYQLPDSDTAEMDELVKTEDGGYVGWLREGKPAADNYGYDYSYFLVRFDAEGRLLWIRNRESISEKGYLNHLLSYDGKIVMECRDEDEENWSKGAPLRFLWMDLDGNELGTTELTLRPEDFQLMQERLYPVEEGAYRFPGIGLDQIVPMTDGLWAVATFCIAEKEEGYDGMLLPPDDQEFVMIRIPEIGSQQS